MIKAEGSDRRPETTVSGSTRGVRIDEIVKSREPYPQQQSLGTVSRSPRTEIQGGLEQSHTPSQVLMYRLPSEDKNNLIYSGGNFVGATMPSGETRANIPTGGVGTEVDVEQEVAKVEASLPFWVAVHGRPVALGEQQQAQYDASQGARLDDRLLAVHQGKPYGFLAREERVPDLSSLKEEVWNKWREAHRVERSDPRAKTLADEYSAQLREMEAGEKGPGYRRVEMYVGATSPEEALAMAGTVAQAARAAQPAYFFEPKGTPGSLSQVRSGQGGFPCSTETSAVLFDHVPRKEGGVFGISVRERAVTAVNHNIPGPAKGERGINLGAIQNVTGESQPLVVSRGFLEGHLILSGKSKSGKSTGLQGILTDTAADGVPFTVVQPGLNPHAEVLAQRLAAIEGLSEEQKKVVDVVLTSSKIAEAEPGAENMVPVSMELLRPYPGYRWKGHLEGLAIVIGNAVGGNLEEKGVDSGDARRIVKKVLDGVFYGMEYEKEDGSNGFITGIFDEWGVDIELDTSYASGNGPLPSPRDIIGKSREVVKAFRYGNEAERTVTGVVHSELESIFSGLSGEVLQPGEGYPLDIKKFYDNNSVASLGNMLSPSTMTVLMGAFLLTKAEHADVTRREHVAAFEEMQDYLKGPQGDTIARMFRRDRNLSQKLIGLAQNLGELPPEIGGNAAHLAMRTSWGSDMDAVEQAAGLTREQREDLTSLKPGEGFLSGWGTDYGPLRVQLPDRSAYDIDPHAKPVSAEAVVRLGADEKPYNRTTIKLADRYLDQTDGGRIVSAWGVWTTVAYLSGLPFVLKPNTELSQHLEEFAEADRDVLHRALNQSVVRFLTSKGRFNEILDHLPISIDKTAYPLDDIAREIAPTLHTLAENNRLENADSRFILTGDPSSPDRLVNFLGGRNNLQASMDRIIGESVEKMIDAHREQEVRNRLEQTFAVFDIPRETLDFLRRGYHFIIEGLIEQREQAQPASGATESTTVFQAGGSE